MINNKVWGLWSLAARENLRGSKKEFNKTEDDLKSLQSVGQIIGEVLRPLDNERCNLSFLFFASVRLLLIECFFFFLF